MPENEGDRPLGKAYVSAGITVYFDAEACEHSGNCVKGLPEVFDVRARPWIQPGNADPLAVAAAVERCPSGALQYRLGPPEPNPEGETQT